MGRSDILPSLCLGVQVKQWPLSVHPPDDDLSILVSCGHHPQSRTLAYCQDVRLMDSSGLPGQICVHVHVLE